MTTREVLRGIGRRLGPLPAPVVIATDIGHGHAKRVAEKAEAPVLEVATPDDRVE